MLTRIRRAAFARLVPPSSYVRKVYQKKTGERLNLDNPTKFNEKLQWLKLYYRIPVLTRVVDKYESKRVVSERLGENRAVPTAALYERADDICLAELPSAVALKATHGSGWNIIARDKSELNERVVRDYFRFWTGKSYYTYSKEWAYKSVRPRVICEPLLIDENGELPLDYKMFCFAGKAQFVQVDFDRFTDHTRAFYDLDWKKQPFSIGYPLSEKTVDKPAPLSTMVAIAEKLSYDMPFLRVDFYVVDDQLFVGELTLYPGNGMEKFSDESWNRRLGDLLVLPERF